MNQEELQAVFDSIRKVYFPKWSGDGWRPQIADLPVLHGVCRREAKTIEIASRLSNPTEVSLIIIHEIGHAVVACVHNDAWRDEMRRAAKIALSLGDSHLAKLLEKEATHVGILDTDEEFYSFLAEKAREYPGLHFDDLMPVIAKGLQVDEGELLKAFPLARRRYNEQQAILRGT